MAKSQHLRRIKKDLVTITLVPDAYKSIQNYGGLHRALVYREPCCHTVGERIQSSHLSTKFRIKKSYCFWGDGVTDRRTDEQRNRQKTDFNEDLFVCTQRCTNVYSFELWLIYLSNSNTMVRITNELKDLKAKLQKMNSTPSKLAPHHLPNSGNMLNSFAATFHLSINLDPDDLRGILFIFIIQINPRIPAPFPITPLSLHR